MWETWLPLSVWFTLEFIRGRIGLLRFYGRRSGKTLTPDEKDMQKHERNNEYWQDHDNEAGSGTDQLNVVLGYIF